MAENHRTDTRWFPGSSYDRALVFEALDAIVSSHHFRGSKRYPAFLKYVVHATLEGRAGELKERTLGVEVLGRDPHYDTNADPVVRFIAGEVRKRIALYYHENGAESPVQIVLPPGSYSPEFQLLSREPASAESSQTPAQQEPAAMARRRWPRWAIVAASATVCVLLVAAVFLLVSNRVGHAASDTSVSAQLWAPLTDSSNSTLIVVGGSRSQKLAPEDENATFLDHMTGPYHHVSLATAIAVGHAAGVLHLKLHPYEIKEASETSLTDIRKHPLVLIGATNNEWTMHLVDPLRFRFVVDGHLARIQDTKDPTNAAWTVNFAQPYSTVTTDYGLVARFRDPTTEGPVLVLGGLGPYGTEAASEFVDSPAYLAQLAKLPAGWENRNIEFVIKSNVINNEPGPPVLVSSTVW